MSKKYISLKDYQGASEDQKNAILFDSFMRLIVRGIRNGEPDSMIKSYAKLASELYFTELLDMDIMEVLNAE